MNNTFLNNILALSARDIKAKISDVTLTRAWELFSELDASGNDRRVRKQFCRLDAEMRARHLIED